MSKPKTAEAAVSGALDRFLQTLGIMDIVSGGLIIYAVWLLTKTDNNMWTELKTAFEFVDVALLAIAAIVAGRTFTLMVEVLHGVGLAVVDIVYEYEKKYEELLSEYSITGIPMWFAANLLADVAPASFQEYVKSRENAQYSLSFALLSLIFSYLLSYWILIIVAALLLRYVLELFAIYERMLSGLSWAMEKEPENDGPPPAS